MRREKTGRHNSQQPRAGSTSGPRVVLLEDLRGSTRLRRISLVADEQAPCWQIAETAMSQPENNLRRRLFFLAFSLVGLLAMAVGMVIVLYVYAFASMVDPGLGGIAYWNKILRGMLLSGAVIPTLLGVTMAISGAFAAIWNAAAAVGLVATAMPTRRTWTVLLASLIAVLAIGIIIAVSS